MSTIASLIVNLSMNTAAFSDGTSKASKAAQKLERDALGIVGSIQRQEATFGKSGLEAQLYALKMTGASEAVMAMARASAANVQAMQAQAAAMERGRQVTEAVRTPTEVYADKIRELNKLLQQGAISQQTYARAAAAAQEQLNAPAAAAAAKAAAEAAARQEREANERQAAAQKVAADAERAHKDRQDAWARVMARGKAVTEEFRTPLEAYGAKHRELRGLLAAGAVSQETYGRAMKSAAAELTLGQKAMGLLNGDASLAVPLLGGLASAGLGVVAALAKMAAAAVAAGVGLLAGIVTATMHSVEQQADLASQLGVTTDALSKLQFTADINGSSAEAMNTALGKMNQNLGDAALNGGPAAAALGRLGLSAADLVAKSPDQAFADIAQAISEVKNPAERASLAVDVFGKSGQNIINVLAMGRQGLAAFAGESDRLGVTLTQVNANKIGAAKDALDMMWASLSGVAVKLTAELAPFIELAAQNVADFVAAWATAENVTTTLAYVAGAVGGVIGMVDVLRIAWKTNELVFATVAASMLRVIDAVGGGIVKLINLIPGVSATWTDSVALMAAGFEGVAQQMGAEIKDLWGKDRVAEAMGFFQKVQTSAANAAAAAANARPPTTGIDTSAKLAQAVGDTTKKLQEQVATFGLSSTELELYKLKQQGATEAQLAAARAAGVQLEAMNQQKAVQQTLGGLADQVATFGKSEQAVQLYKLALQGATAEQMRMAKVMLEQLDALDQQKKLMDEGKQVTQANLTPLEAYQQELTKLQGLLDAGAITQETFNRAKLKAQNSAGLESTPEPAKGPVAIERRFTAGGPGERREAGIDTVAKNTTELKTETAKQTTILDDTKRLIEQQTTGRQPVTI